ncbi:MAG: hypothetical protein IT462_17995 [Planctomycetes bacterium]|nr:hypothetical protein [Planctomycetota bacterium]
MSDYVDPPAEVLVLAIHGSPGDPRRARREFAFLGLIGRPVEVLILSGDEPVAEQLQHIAVKFPRSDLVIAPLLLAAGFHLQHDLLPAVPFLREQGRNVRLLPLWGRSEHLTYALQSALRANFGPGKRVPAAGVLWLVPGGSAALANLRRQVDESRILADSVPQHWATQISDDLPQDALPIIAVLREGRLSKTLRKAWAGSRRPRLLFGEELLQRALLRWTEPSIVSA